MFTKIKNLLNSYKTSLFKVNNRELSALSKAILIVFVISMFYVIGLGIDTQLKQLPKPNAEYGYRCIDIVNKKNIFIFDLEKDIQSSSKKLSYKNYYNRYGKNKKCQVLKNYYYDLSVNNRVKKDFGRYKIVVKTINSKNSQIRLLKKEYSSMLLEKIADQGKEKSILEGRYNNVKTKVEKLENELRLLKKERDQLKDLFEYKEYQKLINFIKKEGTNIQHEFEEYKKYYPLKKIYHVFIFLLPLFLITYFTYKYTVKKDRFILSNLLFNITNVIAIFILFYIIEFIYHIIPKYFFQNIIQFFVKHNLVIVLNYLAIFFLIILFGLIIWKIQKSADKKEGLLVGKSKDSSIKRNQCTNCGCNRQDGFHYCPICGEKLYETCKFCKNDKIKNAKYCQICGGEVE